ncbi:MAG: 3'(2'),5'-bisphosphate nucleotidase CysQ [Acidimicrobiales bacterium]
MTADNDHTLAADLADRAGALLLELRAAHAAGTTADSGNDPRWLKDEADRQANDLLMAALAMHRPDDAVLSEESTDNPVRLDRSRVWIIDPLDGTREFGEPGRDDWAVHVALAVDGEPTVGAVALPAQGLTLSTGAPPPLRSAPAPAATGAAPRLVVSRTRPPSMTAAVQAAIAAEVVPMGSAGAKIAAVITGQVDAYVHDGGQYEWDSAAPVAVALASGLHCSRLDGSPLVYNRPDPSLPDLVVCHPSLAEAILAAVAKA